MKKIVVFLSLALVFVNCKSAYTNLGDGLYADMETAKGNIILKLNYDKAPVTVANFVSLAEGNNPAVKEQYKGKPFYDGLTFHRVITKANGDQQDFMIQGGDPLGTGQGDPGYKFKDEVNTGLSFDKPGILAMANSGPNTNGSQFFITVAPTKWLNNRHTIFGNTVDDESLKVVNAIRKNDKITKVTIVRKGAAAKAFDAVKTFSDYLKNKGAEAAKRKAAFKTNYLDKKAKAKELASGLKIYTEKEGKGAICKDGQNVKVHYTLYLENGKKIDSSVDRGQAFPFTLGKTSLIPGWVEGVKNMKVGEKALLFIPSHLGYGARGAGSAIPGNSDLVFEIEVLEAK